MSGLGALDARRNPPIPPPSWRWKNLGGDGWAAAVGKKGAQRTVSFVGRLFRQIVAAWQRDGVANVERIVPPNLGGLMVAPDSAGPDSSVAWKAPPSSALRLFGPLKCTSEICDRSTVCPLVNDPLIVKLTDITMLLVAGGWERTAEQYRGLLAEAGVRYVCDWPNDEQPYLMKVPRGQMVSLPVAVELDDVFTHTLRFIPIQRYATMIREAFDRLYADGATSGRLLVLSIHPTRIGQPFRVKYLESALAHIMSRHGVWAATGQEIVDWYLAHPPS